MSDELPKGRFERGLALMKLAAKQLPLVGGRLLRGDKGNDPNDAPDISLLRDSAEHVAKVLGDLRGLALKLGQTASYVDGLLPPEATEVYQKALAKLQSAAPTVSFAQVREEVERGLGRTLEEAFVAFDPTPVAAASIGQVHRAEIRDPDDPSRTIEVATKVQYPGINKALTSDLKNLSSLRPVISFLAPGADTRGGMEEVVARIAEELDYEHEATNQERFRALVEGYPDVMIPRVFRSHTAKNVITTEFVRGRTLREAAQDPDQALRNRVGVAIYRFTIGTALTRGVFNTDPHPGNYIVRDDGTTAFLDFGSVKFLPDDLREKWRTMSWSLVNGDVQGWESNISDLMGMEHMDPVAKKLNQQYMYFTVRMVARDEEVTMDSSMMRASVDEGISTAKKIIKEVGVLPTKGKTMRIPPDLVMLLRMQVGLGAVLAQLRPRANWNRILRGMLEDSDPKNAPA